MTNIIDILLSSTFENNILKLPNIQLDRNIYLDVKKNIELIGGKWKGGKTNGFIFQTENPKLLLDELINAIGSGNIKNLKKDYQFFPTPPIVYQQYILPNIPSYHLQNRNIKILEPSAGQGHLVNEIIKTFPNNKIDVCELMTTNKIILLENYRNNINFISNDIFDNQNLNHYDLIIANPPFAKNQDIEHIMQLYRLLRFSGTLISLLSPHCFFTAKDKTCKEFFRFLEDFSHKTIQLDENLFKESGTMIKPYLLILQK